MPAASALLHYSAQTPAACGPRPSSTWPKGLHMARGRAGVDSVMVSGSLTPLSFLYKVDVSRVRSHSI